ncbi:MAG: hypothetical protein KDB94_06335 [Acidobacteria bacterium]|nr:hypothetical protein [Acidobacteriota bacterium]
MSPTEVPENLPAEISRALDAANLVPDDPAAPAQLAERLEAFWNAPLGSERLAEVRRLIRWMRNDPRPVSKRHAATPPITHSVVVRAVDRLVFRHEVLIAALEGSPALRERTAGALAELVEGAESLGFFGETGLPSGRGLGAELAVRIWAHLLPRSRERADLEELVHGLYRSKLDVDRLAGIPIARFRRLIGALTPPGGPNPWAPLPRGFADGFRLVLARMAAQGLRREIRERSTPCRLTESPFYRAARHGERLIAAWEEDRELGDRPEEFAAAVADCRRELSVVREQLEKKGVSVDVVFALEVLELSLDRLDAMAEIVRLPPGDERAGAVQRFVVMLAHRSAEDRSVRALLRRSVALLHRKIVDRSGEVGEHYVARDRREYRWMWTAALGGGLVTVGTAAIKVAVHALHLAPAAAGLLYSLNYAITFLLLQRFHLVLATKQPAMTAAKLAAILRDGQGAKRAEGIVDYSAAIVSTQLAATFGNVIAVSIGAFAFENLWHLLFSQPFVHREESRAIFESLSPVDSGTIFYSALTGVLLWAGSLCGGWLDNWSAYHRLPEAIARHPLGKRFGRERMARIAESVRENLAGWGTNVSLGFLLGMTPAVGAFLGVPLDVRHVTLNTGVLSLAASGLGAEWFQAGFFVRALVGVAVMFVLNLSVSFGLSLITATRAYGIGWGGVVDILKASWRRWTTHPGDFLLPPRTSGSR